MKCGGVGSQRSVAQYVDATAALLELGDVVENRFAGEDVVSRLCFRTGEILCTADSLAGARSWFGFAGHLDSLDWLIQGVAALTSSHQGRLERIVPFKDRTGDFFRCMIVEHCRKQDAPVNPAPHMRKNRACYKKWCERDVIWRKARQSIRQRCAHRTTLIITCRRHATN